MNRDELESAAMFLRKYARAVETKLYWNMSTAEAKKEVSEAIRLAECLEAAARNCN